MNYISKRYNDLPDNFIEKALLWAQQFNYCNYFNSNNRSFPHGAFRNILAAGNEALKFEGLADFKKLKEYSLEGRWLIGHLCYDLKNQLENLHSKNRVGIDWPLVNFYEPEHLIFIEPDHIEIASKNEPDQLISAIQQITSKEYERGVFDNLEQRTTKEHYLQTVDKLKKHIVEGDIYEINYCVDYEISNLNLNPVEYYGELTRISPTPFSVFYKHNDLYALGASPERFLKKTGQQLASQPIKGTARRGRSPEEDQQLIETLRNDEKERAENMMIVDLVRNDLSRSSLTGSVKVEELFGIYTFEHWHQMISTVVAQLKPDYHLIEAVQKAFPMGSMTGAPKIKVMELIEKYETFRRGLYSGAIGYITPDGDFDFNVVIRTLFYDKASQKGQFMIGSAITYDAIPEKEYEECELKAKPLTQALHNCCSPLASEDGALAK